MAQSSSKVWKPRAKNESWPSRLPERARGVGVAGRAASPQGASTWGWPGLGVAVAQGMGRVVVREWQAQIMPETGSLLSWARRELLLAPGEARDRELAECLGR